MAEPGGQQRGRVLIGGEWYEKDDHFESINPATEEPIGSAPKCNREDVAAALAAAKEAAPAWAARSLSSRFAFLEALEELVRIEGEAVAALVTRETGKPLAESLAVEILGVTDLISGLLKAGAPALRDRSARAANPLLWTKENWVLRAPLGVVGVISPWNLPFSIPMGQILCALAAGNTVVFKPSEFTPLTGIKIAELLQRSGLPPGVLNIVTGLRETGEALVDSQIDGLLFTGSTATGRRIAERLAPRFVPAQLELSGKDAFIVLPDAPMARTARGAVWGAFFGSGQACASAERFFVHRSVAEKFLSEVTRIAKSLAVGDGADPSTQVGPLISDALRSHVEAQVREAVARGAKLHCGGKRPDRKGFFFEPAVLSEVPLDSALMREETFGPVLPVALFDEVDEAVTWANGLEFGLSASVWTANLEHGHRIARRLNAGSVWVNEIAYSHMQFQFPWGGNRASGMGRSNWVGALHELTTPKFVGVDKGRREREVWWFPYDEHSLALFRRALQIRGRGFMPKLGNAWPLLRSWLKLKGYK